MHLRGRAFLIVQLTMQETRYNPVTGLLTMIIYKERGALQNRMLNSL